MRLCRPAIGRIDFVYGSNLYCQRRYPPRQAHEHIHAGRDAVDDQDPPSYRYTCLNEHVFADRYPLTNKDADPSTHRHADPDGHTSASRYAAALHAHGKGR